MRQALLAGLAFFVVGCGCDQATAPEQGAPRATAKPATANPDPAATGNAGGPQTGLAAPTKSGDSELEVNPNANFNKGR